MISLNKGRKWHYLGHFLIASELANKPVHGQLPLFCHSSIAGSHISTKRTTAHLIVIISKNHQYPFLPLTSYPHLLRYSYLFKRCHLPHSSTHSATTLGWSSTTASLVIREQKNSLASLPSIVGSRCWRSRATISQRRDLRISSKLWQETPLFGNSSSNTTI